MNVQEAYITIACQAEALAEMKASLEQVMAQNAEKDRLIAEQEKRIREVEGAKSKA